MFLNLGDGSAASKQFFFHIRSKADAYYEPWSKAITGESGNEGYMV